MADVSVFKGGVSLAWECLLGPSLIMSRLPFIGGGMLVVLALIAWLGELLVNQAKSKCPAVLVRGY